MKSLGLHLILLQLNIFNIMMMKVDLDGELVRSLNGMQNLMRKLNRQDSIDSKFDPEFVIEFTNCLKKLDPTLWKSVNSQWRGFQNFSRTDTWKQCDANDDSEKKYLDLNCTVQDYGKVPIWEPCNYASNIAYYRAVMQICKRKKWSIPTKSVSAIGKALASIGLASSLYHASQTTFGHQYDQKVIDLIIWIIYREALQSLNLTKSDKNILLDLSDTPRKPLLPSRRMNAMGMVDYLMNSYIDTPVEQWGKILNQADIPKYSKTLPAMVLTVIHLITLKQPSFVYIVIKQLLKKGIEAVRDVKLIGQSDADFLMKKYMVRNKEAMKNIAEKMEKEEINSLFKNTLGGSLKGGYAILWGGFIKVDLLTKLIEKETPGSRLFNEFGHNLISLINRFASAISTFRPIDKLFQDAINFYPGQTMKKLECNKKYPHPKWHVQSGIALVDLVFVADEIYHLIDKYENERN